MATIDELRGLLARAGWWTEPRTWILKDQDLIQARKAPFEYSAGVLGDLVPGGLYLLRGPRRVGKSVEVKKTIERVIASGADPRRILHVAADRLGAGDPGGGQGEFRPQEMAAFGFRFRPRQPELCGMGGPLGAAPQGTLGG